MATTASCVSACTARMRAAMSLVALAARSASLRISSATTAKRTPDSPAPAASMAAFSASRFVCEAISSIVSTISEISSERSPRLLIRLAMTCTSLRIRCMPARLSRTAPSQRGVPHVGQQRADLLDHEVDGVDDVAEHVGRDFAALAQITLRDLCHRFQEDRDVLLQLLAPLTLLVALGLGEHLRTQPRDRVVDRARELTDLVARAHTHRVREIAAADLLGHAHDLAQRARDPPRE